MGCSVTTYIGFRKVREPYGWLGNMSPHPVEFDGLTWRTSEALFQAGRFDVSQQAVREAIRAEKSPMGAKLAAKKFVSEGVVQKIQPRTEADLEWMEVVLRLKLASHLDLQQELIRTGDATIFEDISGRPSGASHSFWGAVLVDGELKGDNWLGELWMLVRGSL